MVGRKLLYLDGFVVFTLGSLLCRLAWSLPWLVAFRMLQALGAAMLQANSIALIATAAPPSKLGRAIGAQGAAPALGLTPWSNGRGPAAGGWGLALDLPGQRAGRVERVRARLDCAA
jgi:MFS family permease